MTVRPNLTLLVAANMIFSAGCSGPKREVTADTIYTGGDIITVNDAQPTAEAFAVKDGKILAVGTAQRHRDATQGCRDDASSISPARRCCPASSTRTATTSAR